MKALRKILDSQAKHFEKGGKLEKLYPLWEAQDTFLYTPGETTKAPSHVRDNSDLKRIMITVVVSLAGCIAMAMYNTGLQTARAIAAGAEPLDNWQTNVLVNVLGLPIGDPTNVLALVVHGALYYVPVLVVTLAVGGNLEALFSIVRKHEINEGFLVTWMLFPLILPPTIPLWQVALGIAFGVVVGKEIFGGTGMNVLNPALTARAFLFFAYPAEISGDKVWISAETSVDGYSGATLLAQGAETGMDAIVGTVTWMDAFLGTIPGSMGETSALACLLGAVVLLLTRVASWRIMVAVTAGSFLTSALLNAIGSETNPLLNVPFHWHVVLGGWAFGMVFMATDPVSSAQTNRGRWIYGFLIGVLAILIRVVNPAYPEGMMLAILFVNVFASTIDHYVVKANIKRRKARYVAATV
ncbi:MAG: NADH:ubiquinone reductase (Na(+)-transporting) subunit B [Thermoanaerobaculia bacterium]|nr:NADH:ubiquinone reductase (Na(+)-transporting) subunit B [Thermoanaerobaculia bacterium]